MTEIREIKSLSELKELHDAGLIGNGTFSTGKFALVQKKPLYIAIVSGK
jgi:hypothetical protein